MASDDIERKPASSESAGGEKPMATAEQLRAYIDEQTAPGHENPLNSFSAEIGRLLADRIENDGRGVDPRAYFSQAELLKNDCKTGVDSFSGGAMPRTVTGKDPVVYVAFDLNHVHFNPAFDFAIAKFAYEAFGPTPEFGDAVQAIFDRSRADMAGRESAGPDEGEV